MMIWVDGDACPKAIKEVLFRAAVRRKTLLTLVANQNMTLPSSPFIKKCIVGAGFDVADNEIVHQLEPGDLVITADIPLADAVITKGGIALDPRGELYTHQNIKQKLAIRNLNESLRSGGMLKSGQAPFSAKEVQKFSNNLDKFLTKKQL
ncbi:MAG: YaiI/YqxD family protein [Legionellaceae bacterium]